MVKEGERERGREGEELRCIKDCVQAKDRD